MHQIREDLWETRADSPFPGLTTHAYLWTGGPAGNVLFYSTMTADDFAAIEDSAVWHTNTSPIATRPDPC